MHKYPTRLLIYKGHATNFLPLTQSTLNGLSTTRLPNKILSGACSINAYATKKASKSNPIYLSGT